MLAHQFAERRGPQGAGVLAVLEEPAGDLLESRFGRLEGNARLPSLIS